MDYIVIEEINLINWDEFLATVNNAEACGEILGLPDF